MKKLLSIVIPAYNEERTLKTLVGQVLVVDFPEGVAAEIIIVDDCSTDKTLSIAKELAKNNKTVQATSNPQNMGKSQTVRNGLLQTKGDMVVIQDADLEYDPAELAGMAGIMISQGLDVVYGNRFGKKNKVIYWQNYLGNRLLSLISNIFTYPRIRTWIPDMEVCHKMIRGDVARELAQDIVSKSGFGLEPELTAKLSRYKQDGKHLGFGVTSTVYNARTMEEGKKMHAFRDGFKALREILSFNLRP